MGQAAGKSERRLVPSTETSSNRIVDADGDDIAHTKDVFELDLMLTPDDILGEVLKWVPSRDVIRSCVFVCHQWHNVISTQTFWKEKCIHDHHYTEEVLHMLRIDDFKQLYFRNPYNINLISNPDASKGLNHWNVLWNGGDRWHTEDQIGCDDLCNYSHDPSTKGIKCWATSYYSCGKEQVIDLPKKGISTYVLDIVRPNIIVSEWYAARFDCGIQYKITVQLLRNKTDTSPVTEWTFEDSKPAGRQWYQTGFTFSQYDPGVRYIRYYHEGQDTQFWAGWYGAKMTMSTVMIDPFHTAVPASSPASCDSKSKRHQQLVEV